MKLTVEEKTVEGKMLSRDMKALIDTAHRATDFDNVYDYRGALSQLRYYCKQPLGNVSIYLHWFLLSHPMT